MFFGGNMIQIEKYPQLRLIAWNRPTGEVSEQEAFAIYERNWRFIDAGSLTEEERQLIERLKADYGNGVMHV